MRKITQLVSTAFLGGVPLTKGNSRTDGTRLYLHGSIVSQVDSLRTGVYVTLAGWNTPTTRERVNGVLATMGRPERVRSVGGEPLLIVSRSPKIVAAIEPTDWLYVPINPSKPAGKVTDWGIGGKAPEGPGRD